MSPKSECRGFKWANNHNKCVHDSMQRADLSPKPCLMRLHYISDRIKLGRELIRSYTRCSLGRAAGHNALHTCTSWHAYAAMVGSSITSSHVFYQQLHHFCVGLYFVNTPGVCTVLTAECSPVKWVSQSTLLRS